MRTTPLLVLATVSLISGSVAIAQQSAAKPAAGQQPASKRVVAARGSSFKPVASILELMQGLIDPSSDFIFDAVSTVVTNDGSVDKAPTTDDDWATVRKGALIMIEGANLVVMPGRRVADPSKPSPFAKDEAIHIVNSPAQIEAKIAKDRKTFLKLAQALSDAGSAALKAADARDVNALYTAGDTLDEACESCHLNYWYPDQVGILDKADQLLDPKFYDPKRGKLKP